MYTLNWSFNAPPSVFGSWNWDFICSLVRWNVTRSLSQKWPNPIQLKSYLMAEELSIGWCCFKWRNSPTETLRKITQRNPSISWVERKVSSFTKGRGFLLEILMVNALFVLLNVFNSCWLNGWTLYIVYSLVILSYIFNIPPILLLHSVANISE